MCYTIYEQNVIFLAEEFSKDPCDRTLHNLVVLAQMNDLQGFAELKIDSDLPDEWFKKLNDKLWSRKKDLLNAPTDHNLSCDREISAESGGCAL